MSMICSTVKFYHANVELNIGDDVVEFMLENLNTTPSIHAGSSEVPLLVELVMEPLIVSSGGLVRFFEYAV